MSLCKVISGGQTGVDQGALSAAMKLKIPVGGWAPKGYRCETGRMKVKYAAKLREAPSSDYRARTEMNVKAADATLIYCHNIAASRGTKLTVDLCRKHGKPWFDVVAETSMFSENEDGYDHIARLIADFEVINVAGSRESGFPGIFEASRDRLLEIFRRAMQ